jgi:L-fuconolactonase
MRTFDSHVHFWQVARGDDILILQHESRLRQDYLPECLLQEMASSGVDGVVVIQSAPTSVETDFLLTLTRDIPWVRAVVGWADLTDARGVEKFCERKSMYPKLVGMRAMLHRQEDPNWISNEAVLAGVGRLVSAGLTLDVTAHPKHLAACVSVLQAEPTLRLMIDHLGFPETATGGWQPWADGIRKIASHQGAACKFSGLLEGSRRDENAIAPINAYVRHAIECFGPTRIAFGSNWPVVEVAGGYSFWHDVAKTILTEMGLAHADCEEILCRSGPRFYKL